jgi:hypothetical protein
MKTYLSITRVTTVAAAALAGVALAAAFGEAGGTLAGVLAALALTARW